MSNNSDSASSAELAASIRAAARALSRQGLQRGERIAILSANRSEYLVAYLGAMQAGFVPVPVNHRFPRELSDFVIHDAGARLLFCDAERLAARPPGMPTVVFGTAPQELPAGATPFADFLDPGPFEPVLPAPEGVGLKFACTTA